MNRNAGLSAGVIALIAFVVHIALPTGPEGRSGGEARGGAARSEQPQATVPPNGGAPTPSVEREGPWLATRHFFGYAGAAPAPLHRQSPTEQPQAVDFSETADVIGCADAAPADPLWINCGPNLAGFFGIPGDVAPKFLLATVPDPLHTRLSLFTDSSIQAIQNAAAGAHWIFATQWLPWNDTVDPDEKDPEKRQKQREAVRNQEKQPGILLFRHDADCQKAGPCDRGVLVVFVLGETPTAGVNPTQFQLARAYMRAIQEPEKIRIQGPAFSGSFDSLYRLIKSDIKGKKTTYEVQSGTATDTGAGGAFKTALSGVVFHSASARGSFRDVLGALGISTDRAAELVEEESGYGESVVTEDTRENLHIRVFRFPRDISHLRNAWREAAPASKSSGAPAPDLDFSLKDTETGEDSVPMFSATQSPLSQNAVLDEITGAIRRDRVRIVRIDATNVLDLLFLTRVLKRQCPDTRLLIAYPDLLFVEAAQSDALSGTLALSTYPMFAAANVWMGQGDRPATFPDANSEGVYNATLLLLDEGGDGLADYHWNDGAGPALDHPPTWLLTLDREGFLPVELWRNETPGWFRGAPVPPAQKMQLSALASLWILLAGVIALAILGLAVWIGFLASEKRPLVGTAFDMAPLERRYDKSRLDHLRLYYLLLFILALTAIEAVVWAPFCHPHTNWTVMEPALLPGLGLIAGIRLAGGCLRRFEGPGYRRAAMAATGTFLAVVALWIFCCYGGERSFFFSFRALELRIGTSPAWPVLAALAILLAFALAHLWRLYMVVWEKPGVAMEKIPTLLRPKLQRSYRDLNRSLASPLGLFRKAHWTWARYALLLGATIFLAARVDTRLSSIDGRAYNILSISLTLLAAAALLVTSCQVVILWRALEGILGCLNTMPLGRSFVRTDQSGSNRPIWVKQLNVQSIDVHARSMLVLHDMALLFAKSPESSVQCERWKGWMTRYHAGVEKLLAASTRTRALAVRQSIRNLSREIATEAFAIAFQHWTSESLVGKAGPAEPAAEGEAAQPHAPLEIRGDPGKIGNLAETFVALHYSPYLLYCVRQIRNLMLFLSVGFLFLVLCLNSYSHQSPQFIGRTLFIVFTIVASVTMTCLVGLERDPILSRIAGTTPGKLDVESYLKVIGYGTLPVLGLLASQFPSISGFLYSWVAPTLQALH